MVYWIIGFVIIIFAAFIIIKLTVNTNENSDSNLGILKHPSSFEKQGIEYVDESLGSNNEEHNEQI